MPVPAFDRWPFAVRMLYDPVRALDLLDRHDVPDHTKIIPFLTLLGIFALKLLHAPITVMEMTVLLTASFGAACWRMFLRERTLTGVANTTVAIADSTMRIESVQRQIIERRDADLGVDPAP